MNKHFNYGEYLAKNILKHTIFKKAELMVADAPDIQSTDGKLGIEYTFAVSESDASINNMVVKRLSNKIPSPYLISYYHKKYSISNLKELISNDNVDFRDEKPFKYCAYSKNLQETLEHQENPSSLLVDIIRKKLEKVSKGYYDGYKQTDLFVRFDFRLYLYNRKEIKKALNTLKEEVANNPKLRKKSFNNIYIYYYEESLYKTNKDYNRTILKVDGKTFTPTGYKTVNTKIYTMAKAETFQDAINFAKKNTPKKEKTTSGLTKRYNLKKDKLNTSNYMETDPFENEISEDAQSQYYS